MVTCCPLSGSDDADPPKVHDLTTPRAAKDHRCSECGETIAKGSRYELVKGMWDDSWSTYRTCLSCVEIRDHFACDGFIYGQLWEELAENFFPDMKCGGPCMDGLSPDAKQRLIDLRVAWLFERDQDAPNDHIWDGWRPVPLLLHLRGTSASYDPERARATEEAARYADIAARNEEIERQVQYERYWAEQGVEVTPWRKQL